MGTITANLVWLLLGASAAAAFIAVARREERIREKTLLGWGLLIAAAIYVGFALAWGSWTWVVIELLGVAGYGLFYWLARSRSYLWLAIGWGLHPAWDVLLHLAGPGAAVAPEWYAVACISFDLLVAGYIGLAVGKSRLSCIG